MWFLRREDVGHMYFYLCLASMVRTCLNESRQVLEESFVSPWFLTVESLPWCKFCIECCWWSDVEMNVFQKQLLAIIWWRSEEIYPTPSCQRWYLISWLFVDTDSDVLIAFDSFTGYNPFEHLVSQTMSSMLSDPFLKRRNVFLHRIVHFMWTSKRSERMWEAIIAWKISSI